MPDLYNKIIVTIINTGPANEYMVIFLPVKVLTISSGPRVVWVAMSGAFGFDLYSFLQFLIVADILRIGLQLHKDNCANGYTMIIIKMNVTIIESSSY